MSEAWIVALEALGWAEQKGTSEDSALRRTFKRRSVTDRRVAGDASRLLYSVSARRNTLDYIIDSALEPRTVEGLDAGLRSFMRLYAYLTRYGGCTPSEVQRMAAQAGGILGDERLRPVGDALDLIPRQDIQWSRMSANEETAYRCFLPLWYVRYIRGSFDERTAAEIFQPTDTPRYARVNTLNGDDSAIEKLTGLGFRLEAIPELKHTYRVLGDPTGLTATGPYRGGAVILQDKASVLVCEVAAPWPGDTVLDVCAAPGVKTSHLAQIMGNRGRIISVDSDARRLAAWRKLTGVMGVTNAEGMLADATRDYELPCEVDVVLLDPPCSGTGTFNTIPSGKWSLTEDSIREKAATQRAMIEKAAPHLRKGGLMVYSTCSVTVEENEGVVGGFLEGYPEFRLVEAGPRLGRPGLLGLIGAQRLYPSVHSCEGFFIAKLEKTRTG